jgi:hypothetical protein
MKYLMGVTGKKRDLSCKSCTRLFKKLVADGAAHLSKTHTYSCCHASADSSMQV